MSAKSNAAENVRNLGFPIISELFLYGRTVNAGTNETKADKMDCLTTASGSLLC